jgi:hypothetical protein
MAVADCSLGLTALGRCGLRSLGVGLDLFYSWLLLVFL